MTDLQEQIRALMDSGIRPVRPEAARTGAGRATFRSPKARSRTPARLAAGTVGLAAAASAAALVASQVSGPAPAHHVAGPVRSRPAVLTDTFIRHVASQSRLALARSGEAVVRTTQTQAGTVQQSGTDDITFDGANWNDSFSVSTPAQGGQQAGSESAINRVVGGQAYDYFVAADGLAWYHDTGPDAVTSMHIPDPRKLLAELAPAAGFVKVTDTTIGGVAVEELQATNVAGLPDLSLPQDWASGKLAGLTVWVDASGVVRQLSLTTSQTVYEGAIRLKDIRELKGNGKISHVIGWKYVRPGQLRARAELRKANGKVVLELEPGAGTAQTQVTTSVVTFEHIGQPQTIRVPAHAIPTYGLG